MRRLIGPVAALAVLALGAPTAHAGARKQCGELAFNAGTTLSASNYGAGEITALRTSCPVARMVARALEGKGGLAYTSHRFNCKGKAKSREAGARKDWRCTRTATKRKPQVVAFFSIGA
jgi:hypothetical protein